MAICSYSWMFCDCRVFSFVFGEPVKRLLLCVYWVCLIYASVIRFYNISKNSKVERILLRKYYHLMAVSMFSPALIFQVIWLWSRICCHFHCNPVISILLAVCFSNTYWWLCHNFQPEFLDLAFGAALAVFLILEIIRVSTWDFGLLMFAWFLSFCLYSLTYYQWCIKAYVCNLYDMKLETDSEDSPFSQLAVF